MCRFAACSTPRECKQFLTQASQMLTEGPRNSLLGASPDSPQKLHSTRLFPGIEDPDSLCLSLRISLTRASPIPRTLAGVESSSM